mgnify:CR=1 FL=1
MTQSPRLRDDQVMERIVRPAVDRILRDGELDRPDIIEGRSRNLIDVRITVGDEEGVTRVIDSLGRFKADRRGA